MDGRKVRGKEGEINGEKDRRTTGWMQEREQ